MAHLTRRGARNVTADLDRLANLFQHRFEVLGVPQKFAMDFAWKCDVLADHIEKHALKIEAEQAKAAGEEEAKKEASSKKKAQDDETGLSVDHGESGFDANAIADQTTGPQEILPPVESWMSDFFKQNWFQQLREKQQGGDIGFFVSASLAKLRRMASVGKLGDLRDLLQFVHAKLEASDLAEVKGLAGDVQKMVATTSKVHDLHIQQAAEGGVSVEVAVAADKIAQAVGEVLPYLRQAIAGVDTSSPTAVMEFQQMVGGGSLKELVRLAAEIVVDAGKGLGKKDEGDKAASAKAGGEVPEAFKQQWDKNKGEKSDDKADDSKKEAKKAEDEQPEGEGEESKKEAKKAEEEGEESSDEASKSASNDFGYNLFAI